MEKGLVLLNQAQVTKETATGLENHPQLMQERVTGQGRILFWAQQIKGYNHIVGALLTTGLASGGITTLFTCLQRVSLKEQGRLQAMHP